MASFGTLVVIIDRARNLPNRKMIGKQDVYTIVRLGHEVQRTPTDKRAGQVPSWNHEIRFQVPRESENILKLSVFNENSKAPDLIGDCAIDLSALYKSHEFDSWFDLRYKDKPAGEIYAELTFYYTGPPKPKPKVVQGDRRQSLPVDTRVDDLGERFGKLGYAETWDGVRDDRVILPAPGDVRRKSFTADRPVVQQEPRRPKSVQPGMYSPVSPTRSPDRLSPRREHERRMVSPLPEHPYRHAQSQSYSVPQRTQDYVHHKSYSSTNERPVYLDNLRYQVPDSYAQTPMQYSAAHRPLPVAPHEAPAKPAKIPLNLTPEEYDILYRR